MPRRLKQQQYQRRRRRRRRQRNRGCKGYCCYYFLLFVLLCRRRHDDNNNNNSNPAASSVVAAAFFFFCHSFRILDLPNNVLFLQQQQQNRRRHRHHRRHQQLPTAEARGRRRRRKASSFLSLLYGSKKSSSSPSASSPSSSSFKDNEDDEIVVFDNDNNEIELEFVGSTHQSQRNSRSDPMFQKRTRHWIVVVDDELSIRQSVGQLLYDVGYQVSTCSDGIKALETCKSRLYNNNGSSQQQQNRNNITPLLPDVIVSDIRMPNMDGLELLNEIRLDEQLVEIPVVLLTAKGLAREDRIAGYDAGADAYLPKPFDPQELVAIIDGLIERREALSGAAISIEDLRKDVDEIKRLLLEKGGGGAGIGGWVSSSSSSTSQEEEESPQPSNNNNNDPSQQSPLSSSSPPTTSNTSVIFLTPYEQQCLELLCEGLTNQQIATQMFLSKRRVEQLLTGMFRKVPQVKNRTQLVRWAIASGYVNI